MSLNPAIRSLVKDYLTDRGHTDLIYDSIKRGGNNQVYVLNADTRPIVLKIYFRHPDDPRDRLHHEYTFTKFIWENGIHVVPKPLLMNAELGFALYEFVEGIQPTREHVSEALIEQFIEFLLTINKFRKQAFDRNIPFGSDACFSIEDHVTGVQKRIDRLLAFEPETALDHDAKRFADQHLRSTWDAIKLHITIFSKAMNQPSSFSLPREDWLLSPSDFGFHNAILKADDSLIFLDFEYAGWDDMAKTLNDFYCHPAIPVPRDSYHRNVERVAATFTHQELHIQRVQALFPLYQMQWCCILLNEFLRTSRTRREFANFDQDIETKKLQQLQKSQQAHAEIELRDLGKLN